jgi:hypothetical protein
MWMGGRHFWLHAGRDLTGHMSEAPHGEEILERVPRVGVLDERPATRDLGINPTSRGARHKAESGGVT